MTPNERTLLLEMAARMTQAEKLDDARYWSLQHLIAAVEAEAALEASGEDDAPDGYISRKAAEKRELDALRDRDHWKAKAEALERSEKRRDDWLRGAKRQWGVSDNVSFDRVWGECLALKAKAEALQAKLLERETSISEYIDTINRQKHVVDAAVIWEHHFSPIAGERLAGAVRTFLSQQAPAAPVKTCTTCRFSCSQEYERACASNQYSEWEQMP